MTTILDDCGHHCLLHDGQTTLFESLPPFHDDLAEEVAAEDLSLSPSPDSVDETQGASGSSLPATPAERPGTFCPSSLPLPPASCPNRATLVLDLDGTLIASEELNSPNSTYLWNPQPGARAPDYEAMGRRVWLRPGVREFLVAVRPHFEIVLFTAATQNWAAAAIEQLDPSAYLFDVMLHRDHTTSDLMWDYVKDLSRLGRDLARTVIVDDNPLMFMYQPDNALHIGAYEAATAGGPDNVLERVAEVLISQVAVAEDVREVLGPMASAKSCITSTVSAAPAAATAAVATDAAAVAAGAPTDTSTSAGEGEDPHAAADQGCTPAGCSGPEAMVCDDDADSDGSSEQQSGCEAEEEEEVDEDEQQEQQQHGEQLQQQQYHHDAGHPSDCTIQCTEAADQEEEDYDWDNDSEGGEAFDEHGAAARLGADVEGSGSHTPCHRPHHARQQEQNDADLAVAVALETHESLAADEAGTVAAVAAAAVVVEEQSYHSSEDFEALMEDAIAEYDSDAYEGPYHRDDYKESFYEAPALHAAGCELDAEDVEAPVATAPTVVVDVARHGCKRGRDGSDSDASSAGGRLFSDAACDAPPSRRLCLGCHDPSCVENHIRASADTQVTAVL
ncbi:hypothetical protein Agub_g8783 [Astrephomene gubernaculifera]|uniref:FCP1 homology domain-containing protein n=1 Tax=Astrephomene gubernaculifera TaxID=47775 RepID=A0AAD3DWR9_9CHLO|nr:hypothetical protein Agub_g8783 [Astrephomene gubernaculifera]